MPQRLLIRSVVSNYKYVRKRSHLNPMIIMDWDNPMIIVDISDNNSVTKHLNERKANAYTKLNKLIACGFSNDLINAQIKGNLYETFMSSLCLSMV